ncbi:MAG: TolC family protein [Hyphomonadaceae bacterium]|nr:TolC family protein [Hyphomonadaceae bacterium]
MRPRDPKSSWRAFALAACGALSLSNSAWAQEGALSLSEALRLARQADPRLRAAEAGVDAAEAGIRQARARPNPTLGLEVENFGGQDSLRGFDGSESTFSLSQPIERGGRRQARVAVATQERSAAETDALIARLNVYEDVQRAYYDALATAALVIIAEDRLATAEAMEATVARRVAAARDPLMAGARAEAGTAEARIALESARNEAAIARANLASLIGDHAFTLAPAALELPQAQSHDHETDPTSNPEIARLRAARALASATARLERSRGYMDPTVSVGVRRFEESGDTGLVAGLSIPFGIFDRNRGAIARAEAEERRAGFDVEAARLRIEREAHALTRRLESAQLTAVSLDRTVIPHAARALDLARDGYNQGAFSYLDVLEAQRALTAARQARVETLRTYHHTEAALDRLTARFADALGEETSQ